MIFNSSAVQIVLRDALPVAPLPAAHRASELSAPVASAPTLTRAGHRVSADARIHGTGQLPPQGRVLARLPKKNALAYPALRPTVAALSCTIPKEGTLLAYFACL